MNWLLILTVLYFAWCLVWGSHKGFLLVLYSMSAWIVAILLVTYATPYLTTAVMEHTAIDDNMQASIRGRLSGAILQEDGGEASTEADAASGSAEQKQVEEELSSYGIQMPEVFSGQMFDVNTMADQALEGAGVYDAVAARITYTVLHGVIYVLVLVSTVILLKILGIVLKLVSRIEGVCEVNKLAGAVAGAAKGALILCIFYAAVALLAATDFGERMTAAVYENSLLTWIYEHNPILILVGAVLKKS